MWAGSNFFAGLVRSIDIILRKIIKFDIIQFQIMISEIFIEES